MKIINLTPHTIRLVDEGLDFSIIEEYPFSGNVARVEYIKVQKKLPNGVPIISLNDPILTGLPEYKKGIKYIVSIATANGARKLGRRTDDLLIPNGLVKDERGTVRGTKALSEF